MAKKKTTIKQDKRNYRLHPEENKGLIAKSLRELGAGRSIVIDNENEIIAGNGVHEQAELLGIPTRIIETDGSELIVVKRTDLSTNDQKRKELALADNSTSDSSLFNFEVLAEDWDVDELAEWGVIGMIDNITVSGEEKDIGQDIEFAKELHIGSQYLVIVFNDDDEYKEAKRELSLQRQMEATNKKAEINNTGTERVLFYSDFKKRISPNYDNSDTIIK
jgi:hypothetical protein